MQKKLIVVIGPTCTNKSKLAIQISQKFNTSIINADAFQVYKQLNVGINKPTQESLNSVKHYLINNINITDEWDISIFQKEFNHIYNQLINSKQIPILCGGSHLYVDTIVSGYHFTEHNLDDLINQLEQYTNKELYEMILKKDQLYANKISINNRRRLLRANAVMLKEKCTMTEISNRNESEYKSLVIMTSRKRDQIYDLVNARFDKMFADNKWVDEIKELVNQYGHSIINTQAFKAIGYKEIYDYIYNNKPLDTELIKQKTRRLAKAQLTWCNNKFTDKIIFDWNNPNYECLFKKIKEFLDD